MPTISHDSETPAQGQQVITAGTFIHRNRDGVIELLVAKRAETKKFLPGIYELPGGHIDFGEDIKEGVAREMVEEFHAEIQLGDPFAAFTYANEIKGSHSIEVVFFATLKDEHAQLIINPEDHSEYCWIKESEVTELLLPSKGSEDKELHAIYKGFELLRGEQLDFASSNI